MACGMVHDKIWEEIQFEFNDANKSLYDKYLEEINDMWHEGKHFNDIKEAIIVKIGIVR